MDRAAQRREAGRTYLLGAVAGLTVVIGTLYTVGGDTPVTGLEHAQTVTAEFAK